MLATVPDEVARKVVEDVRDYGHGYVAFDREGRATYVPSYLVIDPAPAIEVGGRRMHE